MDKNILLLSGFCSSLCYSLAYPTINLLVMQNIESRMLSLKNLFTCICVILVTNLWQKYKQTLYKYFNKFLILEIFCVVITTILITNNKINITTYYILDSIIFAIITRNIICGGATLKNIVLKNNRDDFDNQNDMLSSLSSILGYGLGGFITININIAFMIMAFGISLDNLFYGYIYNKNKQKGV